MGTDGTRETGSKDVPGSPGNTGSEEKLSVLRAPSESWGHGTGSGYELLMSDEETIKPRKPTSLTQTISI